MLAIRQIRTSRGRTGLCVCVVLLADSDRVSFASGGAGRRGWFAALPGGAAYEKYMEGASGVHGRCTGLAMPVVC